MPDSTKAATKVHDKVFSSADFATAFSRTFARAGREKFAPGRGLGVEDWRKQRRIVRLASEYVMRHHLGNAPCRFDVVSIQFDDGQPVIEVYQNAFSAVG